MLVAQSQHEVQLSQTSEASTNPEGLKHIAVCLTDLEEREWEIRRDRIPRS